MERDRMIISDQKKDDIISELGETIGKRMIARLESIENRNYLSIREIKNLMHFMAEWDAITAVLKNTGMNLAQIKLVGRSEERT